MSNSKGKIKINESQVKQRINEAIDRAMKTVVADVVKEIMISKAKELPYRKYGIDQIAVRNLGIPSNTVAHYDKSKQRLTVRNITPPRESIYGTTIRDYPEKDTLLSIWVSYGRIPFIRPGWGYPNGKKAAPRRELRDLSGEDLYKPNPPFMQEWLTFAFKPRPFVQEAKDYLKQNPEILREALIKGMKNKR